MEASADTPEFACNAIAVLNVSPEAVADRGGTTMPLHRVFRRSRRFPRLMRFRNYYSARFAIIRSHFGKSAALRDGGGKTHRLATTWAHWCWVHGMQDNDLWHRCFDVDQAIR
jgi:hypothetical protein